MEEEQIMRIDIAPGGTFRDEKDLHPSPRAAA
jgi:hypothetical protein